MTNLSDYFNTVDTGDGTAEAHHIVRDKIAYASGVRRVGTKELAPLGEDKLFVLPVVNGNASNGTTGWTNLVGSFALRTVNPYEGSAYFFGGANLQAIMYQDVNPVIGAINIGVIDAGKILAILNWQQSSFSSHDAANLDLAFYDGSMGLISIVESASLAMTATNAVPWYPRSLSAIVPVGTRTIRVLVENNRSSGTNSDGYVDVIQLQAIILD